MDFGTGRFLIRNAHSGNLAVLPDANYSTDIRAAIHGLQNDLKGETWCFVLLSTRNANMYKIQNCDFESFASCSDRPDETDIVQGKTAPRQWTIKETNRPGQYTISAGSDPELYWSLGDDEDKTPIQLVARGTDPHNQWTFQRVSGIEDCIRDIQSDSRTARLKALEDFPSLAAPQLQLTIQSGGLAIVAQLLEDSDTVVQSSACASLTRLAQIVFPQLTIDLHSWQPLATRTRALRTITEFCIVDEIKEVAVQCFMITLLVNMLDSSQGEVASGVLEALLVLVRHGPARIAARQAQIGPTLRDLIASNPPYLEPALIVLAIVETNDDSPSRSRTDHLGSLSQPSVTSLSQPSMASIDSSEADEPVTPTSPPIQAWVPEIPLEDTSHDHPPTSPSMDYSVSDMPFKPQTTTTARLSPSGFPPNSPSPSHPSAFLSAPSPSALPFPLPAPFLSASPAITPSHSRAPSPSPSLAPSTSPSVAPSKPSVHALIVILQGNDSTLWDTATLALRDATQGNTTAKSQALASGALPPLATILQSTSVAPLTIRHATEAIANIVSLNNEAKVAAVEYDIIPPLVQLLENPFVWADAAKVLRLLCENPLARETCQSLNVIPTLVQLLDDADNSARINAAGALLNLSADSRMKVVMLEAGIIAGLFRMIADTDAGLHDAATAALWHMCSRKEVMPEVAQWIIRFIDLLDSGMAQTRANVCRILSSLCDEGEYLNVCLEAGIIPPLVKLLTDTDDTDALYRALRILSSFITRDEGAATLAVTGCLPALAKLLQLEGNLANPNPDIADIGMEIKFRATHVTWGVVQIAEIRSEAIDIGVIPSLVKMVESNHPLARLYGAAALWAIFEEDEGKSIGVVVDAIPALLKLLGDKDVDLVARTKAAGALAMICSVDEGRNALVTVEGIPYLIASLDYEFGDGSDTGKNTFQMLICDAIKFCTSNSGTAQAAATDAIPKLIPLLLHPSSGVSQSAISALSNLSQTPKTAKLARDAIPAILDILEMGQDELARKINAAACLEGIASYMQLSSQEFSRAIPGLITLLVNNSEPAQYAAARAMRQVVNLNWEAKSFGRSNGAADILKQLSEHGETERLRKHAGYTARSLKVYGIH